MTNLKRITGGVIIQGFMPANLIRYRSEISIIHRLNSCIISKKGGKPPK